MSTILIIVILLIIFGGGGGYYAHGPLRRRRAWRRSRHRVDHSPGGMVARAAYRAAPALLNTIIFRAEVSMDRSPMTGLMMGVRFFCFSDCWDLPFLILRPNRRRTWLRSGI